MTINDRTFNKAIIKVARKRDNALAAMACGKIAVAIDELEQCTKWLDVARRRAKDIANMVREPMGG